jgi:hypothetical protein
MLLVFQQVYLHYEVFGHFAFDLGFVLLDYPAFVDWDLVPVFAFLDCFDLVFADFDYLAYPDCSDSVFADYPAFVIQAFYRNSSARVFVVLVLVVLV